MSSTPSLTPATSSGMELSAGTSKDFLTINIAGQMFGIPILQVQDVLGHQNVARIPLAPPQVAGALNLRGRIVTAVNVRRCLGLPDLEEPRKSTMSVVVENDGEFYSLIIDSVGDVLSLQDSQFEQNPPTLDLLWRSVSLGVYRLSGKLLIVLDVNKLLMSLNRTN